MTAKRKLFDCIFAALTNLLWLFCTETREIALQNDLFGAVGIY